MKTKFVSGNLVLRCTSQAEILEVLYTTIPVTTAVLQNKSFASLAQSGNLDPVLHFIEALKQFGTAEGWHLPVMLGEEPYCITFGGLKMNEEFIIVGHIYVEQPPVDSTEAPAEVGKSAQISLEDNVPFTTEMDEHELLDELSRLNNELINNNRELIRQNMHLERSKERNKK